MLLAPKNKGEQKLSEIMRFVHPYLAFVTYRFHVEKSREIGKSFFLKHYKFKHYSH